jgi:hypothetical protein
MENFITYIVISHQNIATAVQKAVGKRMSKGIFVTHLASNRIQYN